MVKLYKTVLILISCYLASYGAEHADNENTNTEELVKKLLRLGEQIQNILGHHELIGQAGADTLTGKDITVEEGMVHVLGGPNDPDNNSNFNPSYRFMSEFYPGKPMFGGKGDQGWNMRRGNNPRKQGIYEEVKEEISEKESEGDTPEPYPIDKLCKEVECPPYTVVPLPVGASGFEMRKYSAVKFVIVTLTAEEIKHPELGFTTSVTKLVSYMEGNNVAKIKIPMTIPIAVVCMTDPSKPEKGLVGGYVQFYLPTEFQDNAPAPTDPALVVITHDEAVMMLTALGGHPSPAEWTKAVTDLVNNIIKAGFACVAWDTYILAEYTGWLDPHQRTEFMFPQC